MSLTSNMTVKYLSYLSGGESTRRCMRRSQVFFLSLYFPVTSSVIGENLGIMLEEGVSFIFFFVRVYLNLPQRGASNSRAGHRTAWEEGEAYSCSFRSRAVICKQEVRLWLEAECGHCCNELSSLWTAERTRVLSAHLPTREELKIEATCAHRASSLLYFVLLSHIDSLSLFLSLTHVDWVAIKQLMTKQPSYSYCHIPYGTNIRNEIIDSKRH